jgi:hypothetical protein
LPERCDIFTVGQFALDRDVVLLVDVEDESNYNNYKYFEHLHTSLILDHSFLILFEMYKYDHL